jgi:signal transduction histidine kinase
MNIKKITCLLLLTFGVGCLCAYMVGTFELDNRNDVITINRIAKEITNNWGAIEEGTYEKFNYPFCVLTKEDTILFQSSVQAVSNTKEALENGDAMIYIEQKGKVVGKVIITTNKAAAFKPVQRKLSAAIMTFSFFFTILSGLYFFYLHKKLIKPFHDLEKFAKEVANGNLDFSLELRRDNIFGPFTQSFDIMREQLKTAKHQELLANQSKKELVASLSHDIKTPVTSIKLTSELLMVTAENERVKDKLNTIYQKAEQINLLVTDLFHSTLEDLEKLKVTPGENYSSILENFIKEADCYDKITLSSIPDCMFWADSLRLNQVIANILYNSYKYANTQVTIHFEVVESFLLIKFQDYGKGVEEEELPLIFNKFYRGKNAATESGSGLGLYICKKLMEQMEGEIYCKNNEEGFVTLLFLKLA